MGRGVVRGARGGAVALIGLSGLLFSCSTLGLAPRDPPPHADSPNLPQQASQTGAAAAGTPAGSQPIRVVDTFDAAELEKQFEQLARRVSPAVVAISATDVQVDADGVARREEINPDRLTNVLDAVDRTVGTGFIIDPDGYIVTNEHVVGKAEQIWVTLDDRKVYPALVVGSDPRADLAVLKVPAAGLPTVKFADPATVRRGQWTVAIGNPYGLAAGGEMAVSVGVVSALGRSLPKLSGKEDRLYSDLIQTTAQINPGNSGGPLFDVRGDVIGVNTAVILPQKQTNGIGFAIPANDRLRQVVQTIKDGREVTYGYLGVRVSTPTLRECKDAGITSETGARVDYMDTGSPAEEAGLKKGDIVVRLNGESIRDGDHFVRSIGAAPLSGVSAVVHRGSTVKTLTFALRRREVVSTPVTRERQRLRWRGLLLGPVPAHWQPAPEKAGRAQAAKAAKPAAGLMVIAMDPRSPLAKEGIKQGSIITTVAGRAVSDVKTLQQILNDVPSEQCALGLADPPKGAVATVRDLHE
jgi:serine protease Do